MRNFTRILFGISLLALCTGLPVVTENEEKNTEEVTEKPINPQIDLEYEQYMMEVLDALESDPEFRNKMRKATEVDIKSGKVAEELEYVSQHVRTKLNEIKLRELDRLRSQFELANEIDRDHMKISEHLDYENSHTFEINDLKKLIKKASEDMEAANQKRSEEFKQYEMQKEFEMYDVDGNGFWDETELKAFIDNELDKIYNSGAPEDNERAEEMERMRVHFYNEVDVNDDGLISLQEFLEYET